MKSIDDNELMTVTGGAASKNTELETALTRLQSDLKDLAKPQQNQSTQLLTAMAFAVVARRLR